MSQLTSALGNLTDASESPDGVESSSHPAQPVNRGRLRALESCSPGPVSPVELNFLEEVISPEETEEHETVVVPLADADEVNPETDGIVMEQLILPSNAVGGASDNRGMVDHSSMQMIDVVVPMNATPGQEIRCTEIAPTPEPARVERS